MNNGQNGYNNPNGGHTAVVSLNYIITITNITF